MPSSSGSRPMAWWTSAARCCRGFWKWWQSRTRSTVTPSCRPTCSSRTSPAVLRSRERTVPRRPDRVGQRHRGARAGTSDCDSYPVMALIISDSVADYPNVLLCRSNRGLLIAEQVYPGSRTACAADARPIGQVAGSVLVRDGSPDRATVHRGQSLLRVLKRRQHLKPVF